MSKYEFDGDKVKKLYGAMQKLGYQQSLGEFEKGFYGKDNYQKRKAVYDVMTENGADLGGSYEDFIGRMRATAPLTTGSKQTSNPERKALFPNSPLERANYKAKRAAAILDGGGGAFLRDQEVLVDEGYRLVSSKLVPERVEDPKSKRLITKPKKYRVPESDVREGGSMVRMVDAYKTVDGRAVPIPSAATGTQGNENQDEDFATQYISGKINREEYKKKAKAKDSEAAIANSQPTMESDEEFLYRTDKRYKEYRDKILNGDGDIDELSPETKAWYLQRVEARIKDAEERQKKYLSIINSDEHQKKLEENNTDFWRNFSQARGGIGAIGREQAKSMLRETDYSDEMNLANAGLGATESELTDLHALRDMLKGKDVGFFRRFKDFFGNRNNLTFGYQDFVDNSALIANKNSKNPLMSSAAESRAKESEAATMYSRSANLRAKAGSVTAEMLPFVIEMASAGSMTSVAGKAAHKAVYSLGTRMLKSAALKGMEEGLLKATGTAALKVGTRGLSWIAHGLTAGALQTVTAGAGETTANITGRMVGQGAKQEDGSYAFEGGEGAVGAVLHGFTSQLIENATEFMGGGLGYGVGKVASKLTKPLAKVGLGGVTDFFGRIAASPISKATSKTLSKFQIQGIPEEIGEEYLGWAGHSMAGDGDAEWSDFADFQKHKELWATMALSVGAMGAFAASGHVPSLLKRRGRSLKMADRAAAGAFSDEGKWKALRDKLDGTDNNNVLRSLYDNVMQDKSLNGRERKAAMLYAGNLLAYRGANLGAIAGKRLALEQKRSDAEDARRTAMVEGAAPSGAESVDEHELDGDDVVSSAFRQGYEETSAANAYMWAKALEDQEGHAMESLGLSEKELNEKFSPQNAGETLNEIRGAKEGTYTEEQKKAAFDYANTRAAYEGVVERTQDDIDSEIAYHHAIVDRQTNIDSGRLHPVKLFTSEKNKRDDAFLVSGRLAFEYNDKGEPVVSTRLSDPTLIVSDAAGRTRMVSPSEIADAEDAIDVDEYKNTLAGHVRQEMEERKYAEMLKAAEEAQANEIGEGEPESLAVDGVSTSEEEKETPEVNENGGQSNVFGGAFNVGDKFSTEDSEFEVVQLTEGEAPIVQNVETGQQFRPHSEEDLRAAVQSYTPAFIDGAENTNGVTTYSRVAQEETAPQNEAQEDSHQEEAAPKPNEAQQEDGTTSENESVDEEQEGLTEDSDSSPSDSQSENTQEESNISLEEVQSALDKGEIEGITPQMAHDALYGDPDLETEEVDDIIENSRSASQANLAKLQKTEIKPRKNESVIAFKKRKAAHIDALVHAEELVRFWEEVQEHRRNLGAQAMQEEENAKQQREAEAAERAKEQAENGLAVAPSWANAEKIVGRPGEFITPNGLRVKGHYVLVESGAAVPSHDARHGFKQSEGFPTDEKGHTLNDRDYERDLDAQRVQREIARNYDARATQQPVVVSPEGFVLSGNGRTMSGDLAAMENTDGAYNSYIREYAEMWGFTSDQVEKLEHPRVVFVSDNPLPLTTETFAAFNAQETKTQSRTEKAVKMGKAVSDEDFAKILRIVTDGHETLSDFYSNANAAAEALNVLETSGVITQQDRANLFDGDVLSDEGRNLLENVLLGKAFEGNPDVVRQLSEVRSLRTSVLNALFYIVENERLNEEFRLSNELSRAINFVYHARKGGGYSFGDKVRTFVQQTELFESTTDVTLDDATVLLLADALNDKRTTLIKSIFKSYNERAEDAGKGQMSLFGDAIPSRETLIMETLALLGVDIKDYAPSNQVEPSNQATNEQQEPKQQQQPEAGTSESTSEQGVEGKTETKLPSGSVSTSGRGNEGVSTEEEGAKPSDKNAKPSEKSTEKGEKAEDIEVDASAEEESAPLKEEEGINESSRGGSLQDEKEKDKAGYKLTTRRRVVKAKARGGREWIDSLRTTADSHYLRLATDVGYISAPEAQAIIRNSHTKDDVLNLLLRKLEANYFDLYQTDVAEEMARRNLPAEDLQRLYDVVMKDPRAYRFYNALDAIAQNKNTPESVLDELYKRAIKEGRRLDKDGNYVDLGLRLAQNPSTSESHLRTLALTHGEDVAKNPSAPVDLLRVFATEKKSPYGSYYALRAAVAQNPSTPADLLLEILRTSDREEAAVEYAVKHPNLKGTDLERAAELASNPSIFNNPNVTDELLEKWASVKGETKAVKTFAELAQIELDERRTSKEEEGKAHLTKSQRELLELVRNPNATAEELQRAYEGEYYDKDDAKQVKKAKELAKVREEVVRAVAAHPNASSTVLYEIYYSEGEEDPELQRIIESRKDDTIGEDILGSKPKSRIREQRVGTSDIVVGQTVYFKGQPWKVEAISPNGKLTITTEILGHVLRHENILPRWVRLEPVEEKQSDKELSHANNTVSEEQGDTKSARESDSEALNSIESRDKDYADAVARGDIETAERMLAEEAERKGYSLDSPYQGESAFNGKAPSDSGYYENAEERKKAYDEGDYEGAWTLADELVHGVDVGSLVDFRLSDNELRRANDMTRESILNLREALRKARSGEKNITIKMYRSVPPGVKEREFRNGDWITPSRLYALDNAEIHEGYEGENQEGWNGGYRIIEQEVPIEDVWWDGNDVNEWGYDNGEAEAYRNTENNRKTFSVTYDSEGNLIPLSKRFDETNSDARYSKDEEQRAANEAALDGVSPEQIELRDGLVDIMRDAGMDVSVSDAEGQRVLDLARGATVEADAVREAREIERVNAVFNDELDAFSEDNANRIIFSLGRPSEVLRAAGVPDMPMKLYGSKLLKKIKKHGFDKVALRDLPRAVANPIAVFNNHKQEGNRAILTELHTEQGNVLVAIDLGKGADVDFNVVSSVFGKGKNGVVEWINKRQFTYVDEEKALNYLHLAAPIAAASDNQKLSLAANIIKGFKNPKLSGENLRQQRKKSITEEMQSIKTKAQSDGTFMLAPNSEPTNLTERQWLQVRTEAFKEWFGDWENDPESASKVVDENGEPRVVYHQTSEQFTKFDLSMSRVQSDVQGFFFSSGTEDWSAMGDEKMAVFLNLRNPVDKPIVDQSKNYAGVVARENLLKAGNDGAISFDEDESEEIEYLVLSPSQIKSATDNVGAFDKGNDDIRFYRGQHGEVRGFAVGGRIYLDPKMASDETAIHEYTHLWADALRRVNPAEWENVKGLLRDTPIWEETKRLYPELADDEDALADEVLAQFSGKHGAKRLAEAREKAMSEADGVFDKAKVASVFDNVRQALKRFWKGVADFLGLHFTSAEEVADKVLSDLLNGVNPNDVIANTKDSIREQRIDKDTREEMQRSVDELRVEVREGYEKAVKDWKYKIKEQWQDSMLALKTLQDELEKKGAKIEEWENAYWAENRMSSVNEEEMKAYSRDYFKPIVATQIAASKALPQELTDKLNAMDAHLREFDKMNAEGKKRNAVDNYMMLKHGLERNRVLAMRDAIDAQWENPSEVSSVWRAYNEDAGNRENRRLLQEGKRSFEEFLQVDDAIRAHYAGEEYLKNREKDYSGLTSMTTEELTELKDVENAALQLVKEAEDAAGAELSALWDKVNKATRESVEKLYKSGLLTPAAYSQMTTMFQWYVPLRGFAEETSDEVYDYVDQRNGNGMGAVLKGADGRKSKADSPIAHIGSMAERSVVQGNRNLMKQHFYRMVMAHPNDLVSMGEIYLHHNEVTDEWEMMTPTHSPNASPEQIAEETRAFEERMQELVKQEPDNYLRLREHPDVPYRVLGSNLGEHQVLVKVLGRDKLLTVNGDPRVAQAVNGRFNPDAISNDFLKRLRNLNNFLAQMATQRNPEFIFRNLIRDRFYAMEAARVKDGATDPQYVGRLQKNWISAVGQVVGLTARYNSGTLDMNDAQDRMFYEFMMNGGATGVTRLLNPEEYKGEIADIAKEMQRGKFHYAKVAKLVTKYVDLFGSVSEAITRFATYRTSRELGRSVARSVWDAKEITTNFNKKGAGSKAIRKDDGRWLRMSGETASFFKNFVIFTNANVQGFHNQWQLAKNNPKRFIARFVAKWVALGFAMPLINNLLAGLFGGDDDHYQDLPETARRNSLCLFVPKVGWVKIPLGFGLRSAYAMGGLLSERLFYPKGDYTSMTRSLFNIALDLMPLSMGSSEQDWWLNVVPSSLRPLAENIANKDWTGRPIVNENINENWSEYRRANNRTSNISIKISEALSDMTGGDEYTPGFVNLNPSQFEHIALGLLSGVGTLVGNTYETTANLVQGEKLDTRHIPFLKDFFSTSGGVTHTSAVKRNFYALKDEYEKTKVRVLGYEREEADGKNDPESVARRVDFRKNSKEYKRYEVMDRAVSEVNRIRRYMKEATTPEEVKKMEIDQQKVMEDAINDVRAIK